jgi:predicted phage tail protein
MTRAHYLFALGVALILLSFFVNVPLQGVLGLAATAVVSMALFITGVALVVNQWIQMRRFKDK